MGHKKLWEETVSLAEQVPPVVFVQHRPGGVHFYLSFTSCGKDFLHVDASEKCELQVCDRAINLNILFVKGLCININLYLKVISRGLGTTVDIILNNIYYILLYY